jgi:hypothetical protein
MKGKKRKKMTSKEEDEGKETNGNKKLEMKQNEGK